MTEPSNAPDPSLHGSFLASAARWPERPALEVDGESLTYVQLRERATSLAATLTEGRARLAAAAEAQAKAQPDAGAAEDTAGAPLTAVLMQRSGWGFAGILGALCSGHGYVPMMPSLPIARVNLMLARADTRDVVVDAAGAKYVPEILDAAAHPMVVVCPELAADDARLGDEAQREAWRARGHLILGNGELVTHERHEPTHVDPDDIAYLLFTSGSTGEPKGVMVAHRNIRRFLDVVSERYGLRETDRFSHLFEITFDLSLFDMFAAWHVGGCMCVPTAGQRLLPSRYVTDAALTVWFSVPSAAVLMKDMKQLSAGAFPGLRVALFCGEALPVPVAAAFAEACPDAVVENIYGPTELTLACTHYRWHAGTPEEAENDVVPIGEPYPGMTALVVDEQLTPVAPGETGELIMAGPQRTLGYWRDEAKTAAAFVTPPGKDEVYYRTGDRVRAPADGRPMTFLGRMDSQLKINGYRVELGEIEAALRDAAEVDAAVALGWPPTPGGAGGVVAFLAPPTDHGVRDEAILDVLAARLPKYMVPKRIVRLEQFPLNTNGKIDRKALRARLEAED